MEAKGTRSGLGDVEVWSSRLEGGEEVNLVDFVDWDKGGKTGVFGFYYLKWWWADGVGGLGVWSGLGDGVIRWSGGLGFGV